MHLFCRVPQLGLPSSPTQYLLYYMSLVKKYDVEEEVGDSEDGEREEECNNDDENNDDDENEEAEDQRDEGKWAMNWRMTTKKATAVVQMPKRPKENCP